MNPQDKSQLSAYTLMAKKIIFDAGRMREFLKMLGTKEGALTAVQTVLGVIDSKKPVPPQLAPLLGVNAYLLMVDLAQDVTGQKADTKIMQDVVVSILGNIIKSHKPSQPQTPAAPPNVQQAPRGLMTQGVPA